MKTTEILKRVLVELTKKVKLEQQTLENGTIIEADVFEAGNEVFIVSGEERIALPVGDYTLTDGRVLKVAEEGIIAEVAATAEPAADAVAVDAEDEEVSVDVPEAVAPAVEEIIQAVVEVVAPMIEEVKTEMEKMRKEMGYKKEQMSKQAAAKPFKRNPEPVQSKKGVTMAQNRAPSTMDRILAKLS